MRTQVVQVTATRLGGRRTQPLLVLGPSLGTSAETLWSASAEHLVRNFEVVAWDLPGHGRSPAPANGAGLSMGDLASAVLAAVDAMVGPGSGFHYAGDSVRGAVGLQLLLDAPRRLRSATLLCTAAQIGTPEAWNKRRATVLAMGTNALRAPSAQRWFAPGFAERDPEAALNLLEALEQTSDYGYAAVCSALAGFDIRHRLHEIDVPILAVAGAQDVPTPPSCLEAIADGVSDGRLVVLPDVAHLAPAEDPARVARLIAKQASACGRH